MGMMLRRNERKADVYLQVNGKPVKKEPKTRSLTKEQAKPTPTIPNTYVQK